MIDVKSQQIPLLAKGQTAANTISEPVVFPAFSLRMASKNGHSDPVPPHDVGDDSIETTFSPQMLAGNAIAIFGADTGPLRLSVGNGDPALEDFSRTTPLNAAGDAIALTAGKVPVVSGAERNIADGEVALSVDSSPERMGNFVGETPIAIDPFWAAPTSNSEPLPALPSVAVEAQKTKPSNAPLPYPDQQSAAFAAAADISSVVRPADSNGLSQLSGALKSPQTVSAQPESHRGRVPVANRNMADRPPDLPPVTESGPTMILDTAVSKLTDAADLRDSRKSAIRLSDGTTRPPSVPEPARLTPMGPEQLPSRTGDITTRALLNVPNELTAAAVSPAKEAAAEPPAISNGVKIPNIIGKTGAVALAEKSKDTLSERAPAKKMAPVDREIAMSNAPAGPTPGAVDVEPKPEFVKIAQAARFRQTDLSPGAPSIGMPPEGPAGAPESTMRYAPDKLSAPSLDPKLPEKVRDTNLFDPKGDTAFGGIEQRNIAHSLGSSTAPVNAQQPVVVPRAVYQIAQAAGDLTDRPVEISLNPEELGRVRLTLHSRDGNLAVNVAAERPETLLFLRRHIDQLATQLRDIGYQELTFAFSDQGRQFNENRSDPQAPPQNNNEFPSQWERDQTPVRINLTKGTGVDIRL